MALNNKPLKIHGDGEQTVDLIHVNDIAKIAIEAMGKTKDKLTNEEVIDVGTGDDITVNELVKIIIRLCNSSSEIIYEKMRSGEVSNTKLAANITRQNQIIRNDFKFRDFEEGMK